MRPASSRLALRVGAAFPPKADPPWAETAAVPTAVSVASPDWVTTFFLPIPHLWEICAKGAASPAILCLTFLFIILQKNFYFSKLNLLKVRDPCQFCG